MAKASTASFTENSATVEDTGSRYSQETQTTEVSYECKIVQTHRPQFRNTGVQTDESNFFDEINFCLMMLRCIIILDLLTVIC